jgi:glutamyl-tRNA synthetase
MGIKAGALFGTLREAITGQRVSPPLFETMAIVGREDSLERVRMAAESLRAQA